MHIQLYTAHTLYRVVSLRSLATTCRPRRPDTMQEFHWNEEHQDPKRCLGSEHTKPILETNRGVNFLGIRIPC